VLVAVPSKADYGKLSGRSRDEQVAGARVEVAPFKRDPADFVLWKPSAPDQPGWDSPWGRGRPGWHIECSAMSETHLGITFDIHGGGHDLVFPHHENEIAQSESAHGGAAFARYWMHNGFVNVNGEKMSKSLGNFFTVHELVEEWPGEAIRLLLLKTHYRAPLNFTKEGLREAKAELDYFYRALDALSDVGPVSGYEPTLSIEQFPFELDLEDDLNTPLAIAHLHAVASFALKPESMVYVPSGAPVPVPSRAQLKRRLLSYGGVLGILASEPHEWFRWRPSSAPAISEEQIRQRVSQLDDARARKDYAAADSIRAELRDVGVSVSTPKQGPSTWVFVVKP
jgi:cysteinyl-tRNA synthetase